jgi:hypothetical protein
MFLQALELAQICTHNQLALPVAEQARARSTKFN